MKIAIHQPNFIPWIGYFYKMLKVDKFILLDDVQYSKGSYVNRSKIKTSSGTSWITVPIVKKGYFGQLIMDVQLQPSLLWKKKMLGLVKSYYARAAYFEDYYGEFEDIINQPYSRLVDLNVNLISWLMNIFEIRTTLICSSTLNVDGVATARLINICKAVGATWYFSGYGGNKYQDSEVFKQNGMELEITDFKHPSYHQLWGEFISGLSSIDILFNYGLEGAKILRSNFY